MLSFLIALALMYIVVGSAVSWAKREERRRLAASEFEDTEEVLVQAGHHR
jgi:hypothetical protein